MRASPGKRGLKKKRNDDFQGIIRCQNQKTWVSELRSERRKGWTTALTLVLVLCRWGKLEYKTDY